MTSSGAPNPTTIWRNLYCRKWSGLRVSHAHYARQIPDSIVTFEIVLTFEQAIDTNSADLVLNDRESHSVRLVIQISQEKSVSL